ncbi:MAG: RNB domain-containing ribonuclease [bacterium]
MKIIEFTESALKEANKMFIPEKLLKNRPIVEGYTIDGATSKDLDDGINIRRNGENYSVEVSIADVAQFVRMDSELFNIAFERVETRYMLDFNEPMLPRILSEYKLSLLPNKPNPAITFDIEVSNDGEILDFGIRETAFHSLNRLNYAQFDQILEQKEDSPEREVFRLMAEFSDKLLEARRNKGALAIYDLTKGIYTNEEGVILSLSKELAHKSNIVVQEFMILCNKGLAMYCAKNDLPLLYRNHTAKLNTPDRKIILEQISTVLEEPQYLTALKERAVLWFDRAKYSPMVLGHYGLNEAAYTHATSPIRRIADLINHQLIKSFLNKTNKSYTNEELTLLSDQINSAKLEISEQKAESFKDKAVMALSLKLKSASEEELVKMDNSQFEPILDRAVKSGLLFPNMMKALKNRFENETIDVIMIYDILFKNMELSEDWREFKTMALDFAYKTSGMPISLINMSSQKGFLENFDTEVNQTATGFSACSKVLYNGKLIQPEKPSFSTKKKEAISRSAGRLLYQILDIPFNESEEILELPLPAKDIETLNSSEEKNYVGELLELVIRNHTWSDPEFNFQLVGLSHDPIVNCSGMIEIDNDTISVYAKSNNKKDAKQLAAKKILQIIKDKGIIKIKEPDIVLHENALGSNYIGLLQEFCLKNKLPVPDYQFTQRELKHITLFICDLDMTYKKNEHHWSASGNTKKEAKHIVAEKACQDLLKRKLTTTK